MADESNVIRVGSRKSQLALIQTNSVIEMLIKNFPDKHFEVETMSTTGDKILDTALSKIGEKSLFTKELEKALEIKKVDFVVHSLKDLPTTLPPGMVVGAVVKRDDPHDAVVLHPKFEGQTLSSLPKDSTIGTSSLRRIAQLKRKYPHLHFEDIRGNLNTRLRKLDEGDKYAAIVLAVAGLQRMGWDDRISQVLTPSECMYAVSQGAMAVECREGDKDILEMLSSIHNEHTALCCVAERAYLKKLEGGCSIPIGVNTELSSEGKLTIEGGVYSLDGTRVVQKVKRATIPSMTDEPTAKKRAVEPSAHYAYVSAGNISHDAMQVAEDIGNQLAEAMLNDGAGEILKEARHETDIAIQKQKAAVKDTQCSRSLQGHEHIPSTVSGESL